MSRHIPTVLGGLGLQGAIGSLQERAARAVPAAVQQNRDGCWLRYCDSKATWWAGAAMMHDQRQLSTLATRIAAAEDFYAAYDAPARFQVCPACPADLDDELSRRGYAVEGVVFLQTAATGQIAARPAPPLHVDITDELSAEWFQLLITAHGLGIDPEPEWRLLQRVSLPSAYTIVSNAREPIAVGRAVADTGWVGVFSMATLPAARQQGAASAVLSAFADWAVSQDCPQMYLQVEKTNTVARHLYRRAGFEELCSYHYRTGAKAPRSKSE